MGSKLGKMCDMGEEDRRLEGFKDDFLEVEDDSKVVM